MDETKRFLQVAKNPDPLAAKEPEKHFLAIRTGFRRTDERSGRSVEMFLCSSSEETQHAPHVTSPDVFFVYADDYAYELASRRRVFCSVCSKTHRTADVFDAIMWGRLSTDEGADASMANLSATDLVEAVVETARPKAVARPKA
jgi:hypothetical protein